MADQPSSPMNGKDLQAFDQIAQRCQALRSQLRRVIVGQDQIIDPMLAALLCQGHVLIVGVPGLAKTLLVRTLAKALGLSFKRIQFTPDMMPSDILGTELIQNDPQTGVRSLRFSPGPIFAQLILADEINRTPPRTQAALLEAMAERQVTVAGRTMVLDDPFVVVATQNPIEQEGTYPLPEAQLDRFMFSLWMDYPSRSQEVTIVEETVRIMGESVIESFSRAELVQSIGLIQRMPVSRHVVEYAVDLVRATRPSGPEEMSKVQSPRSKVLGEIPGAGGLPGEMSRKYVDWGAGPRAGQCLIAGARALAAMEGLPTPHTDHVRRIAPAVLRHRLVINYAGTGEGINALQVVQAILDQVQPSRYS